MLKVYKHDLLIFYTKNMATLNIIFLPTPLGPAIMVFFQKTLSHLNMTFTFFDVFFNFFNISSVISFVVFIDKFFTKIFIFQACFLYLKFY